MRALHEDPPLAGVAFLITDAREVRETAEVCCRSCRRAFLNVQQLRGHRCRGHPSGCRQFACNTCGKTFTQKISLQYHNIYVHNGERKAACPHCDYKAPDKAKLSVHLRTHSKLRPFVCQSCGASFKFRSTYRSHVARHTNSGNFVCSQCNKAFTMASELKEHSRIHAVDRPFSCTLCGMAFKQKKRLRVHHRAVHLRDKRYTCMVCGSSHINNWNLRAHMRTHIHEDAPYPNACEHCGSTFRGRAGLAAHLRLRHGEGQQVVEVVPQEEEVIEHIIDPQQDILDTKMIEVFSCTTCGQLCESLDHLTSHTQQNHQVTYPDHL
ncbi:oocyte zinc finger protein XlCOF26-like [Homarus americanus]|uniref:oocyte zinc finger protein XlCOF26-like n=1 Tax=Homarus americanus TaxID=6706 RepID=UPI001C440979|nr:oocyte zinc finger protein XlCOF26-like [Homarus americanus]